MAQLTIPDETTAQAYVVSAAQTVFPFSFAVFAKADLHFSVGGVELLQTDFSLSGTLCDGGGYQGGTITLNTPVSATTCLLWRETTAARSSNFSPSPSVPVRDIDVALNRLAAMGQDFRRDMLASIGGGTGGGVTMLNGRQGNITLVPADLGAMPIAGGTFTGAVAGITAAPGDNTTKLATTSFVTTAVAAIGGGVTLATTGTPTDDGIAARGTSTFAARADHNHNLPTLTALGAAPAALTTKGDLYGYGTVPLRLAVGSNTQILSADSTQASGLRWTDFSWTNLSGKPSTFTPSAHTHVYTDVTNFAAGVAANLTAGTGISISGNTISATGGGSLANSTYPAFENNIKVANSATTNTTNLNALISTLASAGGGLIVFNEPGSYPINGTITLRSNVSFKMNACHFAWSGSAGGNIFTTLSTEVCVDMDLEIFVDEGSSFSGVVIRLHSCANCFFKFRGYGNNIGSTFIYISADSSAGAWPGGGRNWVFNHMEAQHRLQCGTFLLTDGQTSPNQVVTDSTFHNMHCNAAYSYVQRFDSWTDTITFSGNTYGSVNGSGGVGVINNPGSPTVETGVYNIHWHHLAIDTFGTGLGRYGVVLNAGKGFTCDKFFQGPCAENGDLVGTNCASYQFRQLVTDAGHPAGATVNNIVYRQKGIDAVSPTL